MRSLMELLNNEYEIVRNIERVDNEAKKAVVRRTEIEAYPIDCAAKRNDLLRIEEELRGFSNRVDSYMHDLDDARNKIREYFNVVIMNQAADA